CSAKSQATGGCFCRHTVNGRYHKVPWCFYWENVAYSQFYPRQIPTYYQMAEQYGIADHFFSTMMASSFPNHLVLLAGKHFRVIDNPSSIGHRWYRSLGCHATTALTVKILPRHPAMYARAHNGKDFRYRDTCFNAATLADEAQAAGVSWKYYAPVRGHFGYI